MREHLPDASADRDRFVGRLEIAADHDELVAADARERVDVADRAPHAARDAAQQLVAERVAELVVHLLETVEVDVQRGRQRCRLRGWGTSTSNSSLRFATPVSGSRARLFREPLLERCGVRSRR